VRQTAKIVLSTPTGPTRSATIKAFYAEASSIDAGVNMSVGTITSAGVQSNAKIVAGTASQVSKALGFPADPDAPDRHHLARCRRGVDSHLCWQ
jgi:hypothetical protein